MAFAKIYSAQPQILRSELVTVEADLQKGLHQFSVVGLPDKAVEEARDRVSVAIKNSGWKPPKQLNQKITIALAPADTKKEGPVFDLPIALAYLVATKTISFDPESKMFCGELALDGTLRPVKGVLNVAQSAKRHGITELYVPTENAAEAAVVEDIEVFPVADLKQLVSHLTGEGEHILPAPVTQISKNNSSSADDSYLYIRGQQGAKRGLLIAASGGHNIALWGPPGTGKTLLAKALRSLLPPLSKEEAIEVTSIHSLTGKLSHELLTEAPFRSPHHTASYVSVVGGGAIPKPGEATLAHRGVLFLDEFPEFDKRVIESLRQPLEEGIIHVARAKGTERFPADFLFIAAMNPCPCGYYGDRTKQCVCSPIQISRYQRKVSGPIVDRIDLWIEVPRIEYSELSPGTKEIELSELEGIRRTVVKTRAIAKHRFANTHLRQNADMGIKEIDKYIQLSPELSRLLEESARALDLSPRAFHRTIKLARTIADLANAEEIEEAHILEALQYRPKKLFQQ